MFHGLFPVPFDPAMHARIQFRQRATLYLSTLLAALVGCGGPSTAAVPTAGDVRGGVPDLRGVRVMVFPVQRTRGVTGDVDRELQFTLEGQGPEVGWIFPDEMRRALARAPGLDVPLEGLPVSVFLRSEVTRIGDPLYGQLRRISAIMDGRLALIPVEARYGPAEIGGPGAVELTMVLLEARTGRLYWFSIARGQEGPVSDFATVATAVEAVAAQMLWFRR
jgi:hypothetical protein